METKEQTFAGIISAAKKAALTQCAEEVMEYANDYLKGYGVESVSCGESGALYVNLGETYETTIMYSEEEGYFVCSWGDWIEEKEQ